MGKKFTDNGVVSLGICLPGWEDSKMLEVSLVIFGLMEEGRDLLGEHGDNLESSPKWKSVADRLREECRRFDRTGVLFGRLKAALLGGSISFPEIRSGKSH